MDISCILNPAAAGAGWSGERSRALGGADAMLASENVASADQCNRGEKNESKTRSSSRDPVRYAPHDCLDDHTRRELHRFAIRPSASDIKLYPRHIPYSSDKKGFQQKTGRGAFEVFEYTFQFTASGQPHDALSSRSRTTPKEWVVMWDYEIGLVRMTPFFKCFDFQKTVPARAINLNQGLMDLSHSITGGAIAAQGYWIPYESARALAATFCWSIRHALVPLFGQDFPDTCVPPHDIAFKRFAIDPAIVQQSRDQVNSWTATAAPCPTQKPQNNALNGRPALKRKRSDASKSPTMVKMLRPRRVQTYQECEASEPDSSAFSSPETRHEQIGWVERARTNLDQQSNEIHVPRLLPCEGLVVTHAGPSQFRSRSAQTATQLHFQERRQHSLQHYDPHLFTQRMQHRSTAEEKAALVLTQLRFANTVGSN